jgi:hypothetical protein
VEEYRADPRDPQRVDGIEPPHTTDLYNAYFNRRLAWLEQTLDRLRLAPRTADEPASGRAIEIVTPESIERELRVFVPLAGRMLQADVAQDQVDDWAGKVGLSIRVRGPEGEEDMFLAKGHNLDPRAELQAKVARLQNHVLPKVRAGEWTQNR